MIRKTTKKKQKRKNKAIKKIISPPRPNKCTREPTDRNDNECSFSRDISAILKDVTSYLKHISIYTNCLYSFSQNKTSQVFIFLLLAKLLRP